MGKLLLHIGSEKTGSTSLQAYLSLAAEHPLRFEYVTGDGYPHSFLDYSLSKKLAHGSTSSFLEFDSCDDYGILGERIDGIKNNPNPCIISCELFYRDPRALRVFLSCCLKYSVDVSVLALVRSLPEYLRSLYGEALKWGETEEPLQWARRTQESLLSSESLSICSQYCPGQTFLWNFDRLVSEIRDLDPMLYLLNTMLVNCFGFEGFTEKQLASLNIDSVRNQGIDSRLLSIMRESNRSFNDSRITRSLLKFLLKSQLVQAALSDSSDQQSQLASARLDREFRRLVRFAKSESHKHVHALTFAGVDSLFVRL